MAMFERRSSVEDLSSLNRWRTQSPTGSERRKLSFNPVAEWSEPAVQLAAPVAAIEISKTKRIAQVVVAVIYCLLAAGVVFGFAAIKPVLVSEGVYREKCTPDELREGVWVCYAQELRLNLMFTVAAVSTNVCALPVGTILDRYGPRIASIVGCVCLFVGAALLAFAADVAHIFDAYIPGYLFLALGGPFVFISSFQLSNTFPQNSGLILALLTGAFDTSSAVFLGYRLLYQHTSGTFNTKKFFLFYLIVPVLILISQLTIMPGKSYKTVGELVEQAEDTTADSDMSDAEERETLRAAREEQTDEINALLGSKSAESTTRAEEAKAATSGVFGALHGRTVLQQLASPWWILITFFTVVQMLRINYFVATVRTQYTYMLHSADRAADINSFFDMALPLGGIVSIPFIGFVLDYTSTPFVLALLVSIATAIGVFGLIPDMWAAYANIILFVLYRPLYYTAVSDYSAKVFGFQTFGKVYGLIICMAGLCNFAQAGLDALTHEVWGNDPRPVNAILLTGALVVGVALVGFVWRESRRMRMSGELDRQISKSGGVRGPGVEEVDQHDGRQSRYGTID
jgi:MFS family permease